jgi:hypothetical protein
MVMSASSRCASCPPQRKGEQFPDRLLALVASRQTPYKARAFCKRKIDEHEKGVRGARKSGRVLVSLSLEKQWSRANQKAKVKREKAEG